MKNQHESLTATDLDDVSGGYHFCWATARSNQEGMYPDYVNCTRPYTWGQAIQNFVNARPN
jgi:hypothetical protein